MLRKTKTIKDEHFVGRDDIYTQWYKCPACEEDMIFIGSSYCPDCGTKLKWDLSEGHEKQW